MESAPIYATQESLYVAHYREGSIRLAFDPKSRGPHLLEGNPKTSTRHPTDQEWNDLRGTIESHWLKNGMKLYDLQRELETKYGFVASKKMYMDRFASWNFRKNYNEEDYAKIFKMLRDPNADVHSVLVLGERIKWPRVTRRLRDKNHPIRQRRKLLALVKEVQRRSAPGSLAKRQLKTPEDEVEQRLRSVRDYFRSRFLSRGGVDYFRRPESSRPAFAGPSMYGRPFSSMLHPAELNQHFSRGLKLVATNHFASGFQLLDRASAAVKEILRQEHPALIASLFATLATHDQFGREDLHMEIGKFASEMSTIVLGEFHAVTQLCNYLLGHRQTDCVIDFWRRWCAVLSDLLGKKHRISIYMNHTLWDKLLLTGRYEEALLHVETMLDPVFADTYFGDQCVTRISAAALCHIRRKARTYRCLGKYKEAVQLHQKFLGLLSQAAKRGIQPIAGNPIFEETFRAAEEIGATLELIGKPQFADEAFFFALRVCVLVRGEDNDKTSTMISDYEKRLTDKGDYQAAASLRAKFPTLFSKDAISCQDEEARHGNLSPVSLATYDDVQSVPFDTYFDLETGLSDQVQTTWHILGQLRELMHRLEA